MFIITAKYNNTFDEPFIRVRTSLRFSRASSTPRRRKEIISLIYAGDCVRGRNSSRVDQNHSTFTWQSSIGETEINFWALVRQAIHHSSNYISAHTVQFVWHYHINMSRSIDARLIRGRKMPQPQTSWMELYLVEINWDRKWWGRRRRIRSADWFSFIGFKCMANVVLYACCIYPCSVILSGCIILLLFFLAWRSDKAFFSAQYSITISTVDESLYPQVHRNTAVAL